MILFLTFLTTYRNPIAHLPDNDFTKYSLQLNLYKYILEKNYGVKVSKMILTSFHKNCSSYICTEIGDLSKEINDMLDTIR